MKRMYLMLLAGLIVSGCATVKFEQPVPPNAKALKQFPEPLTGTYVERQNKDTLVITANAFRFGHKGDLFHLSGKLTGENTVLKKSGDFYLLSISEKDDPFWEVLPFKFKDNTLTVYALVLEDKPDKSAKEEKLEKIRQITPVKVKHTQTGEHYLINPSEDELERLLRSGLFDKAAVFEKVK